MEESARDKGKTAQKPKMPNVEERTETGATALDKGKTAQKVKPPNVRERVEPGFFTMRDLQALTATNRSMIGTVTTYLLAHLVEDS